MKDHIPKAASVDATPKNKLAMLDGAAVAPLFFYSPLRNTYMQLNTLLCSVGFLFNNMSCALSHLIRHSELASSEVACLWCGHSTLLLTIVFPASHYHKWCSIHSFCWILSPNSVLQHNILLSVILREINFRSFSESWFPCLLESAPPEREKLHTGLQGNGMSVKPHWLPTFKGQVSPSVDVKAILKLQ